MTQKPFGVNITLLPALSPPDYPAYAQVVIDEGIRIVETAGNSPGPVIKQLKAAGITILHKCTTIRHAQSAIKLGVDFLSIDGFECAGHVGEHDITNFILLSKARQTLKVPFIASGGFADGQGLAAALSLGAEGINMGTRFMCTVEAPIHNKIKQAIVDAQETDTELVLRKWRNTSRLFSNKVAKEAVQIEQNDTTGDFGKSGIGAYVSGQRGRQVFLNGDKDYGVRGFSHPAEQIAGRLLILHRSGQPARSSASSTIFRRARTWCNASSAKPWTRCRRHSRCSSRTLRFQIRRIRSTAMSRSRAASFRVRLGRTNLVLRFGALVGASCRWFD